MLNLLAKVLMEYHDADRAWTKAIWQFEGWGETVDQGVNRKNKGRFEHAQYLVGVP